MRICIAVAAVLLLLGGCTVGRAIAAESVTLWSLTGNGSTYQLQGTGDPTGGKGADVKLSSNGGDTSKFGGALTTLDATQFRKHTVTLSAELSTRDASAGAALWLRADGPAGLLAFANSQDRPVTGTSPPTSVEVEIDVPAEATQVVFGALLIGNGEAKAEHMRLVSGPEVTAVAGVLPIDVLEKAIQVVRANALRSRDVDWWTVEPEIRLMAKEAKTSPQVYPAIRAMLAKLGDHHSFLMELRASQKMNAQGYAVKPPKVSLLAGSVGYVAIPGFVGTDEKAGKTFASTVVQAIAKASGAVHCGWIVDLRDNTGGNMWPMLAALKPFLGEEDLGSFVGSTGRSLPWRAPAYAAPGTTEPDLSGVGAAILIGPKTASAGEAVAIAFRGRPHTRSFGEPTAGLTSGNEPFDLPDGSRIMLATVIELDREGNEHRGVLEPDQPVAANITNDEDAARTAAQAWLQSSGCAR